MAELIAEHDEEERAIEAGERERHEHGATFRELAAEWLEHLQHERGAKPSTLSDYRYMLAEPGAPHRRGKGKSPGVLMAAFGDRPAAKITTREVSAFLRGLDRQGVSPRLVNKNRQVLSAIFGFACRADTHRLPFNPVAGTTKRREPPPAVMLAVCGGAWRCMAVLGGDRRQGSRLDPAEWRTAFQSAEPYDANRTMVVTGDHSAVLNAYVEILKASTGSRLIGLLPHRRPHAHQVFEAPRRGRRSDRRSSGSPE
jgi:hypothetical protein